MKLKSFSALLLVLLCSCMLFSCGAEKTSDGKQNEATKKSLAQAHGQVGMPNIVNFQQRKLLKQIYELCDRENLITYMYTKSDMTGQFIYQGKAIGYGIPFSAQFTNPAKIVEGDKYFGYDLHGYLNYLTVLPQADPNGIFMPTSSAATWMMMIDYYGVPRVVYTEPEIVVSPFPLPYAKYPAGFKPGIPKNYPGAELSATGPATRVPVYRKGAEHG